MTGLLRFARNDKDCGRVWGIDYDWGATVITRPRGGKGGENGEITKVGKNV